jgi:hypothetical protein
MKFYIQCPKCQYKPFSELESAKSKSQLKLAEAIQGSIDKGECYGCGEKISLADTQGVIEFLNLCAQLQLPLAPEQLQQLIEGYFRKSLGMSVLDIVIEEDMAEKVRRSRAITPPVPVDTFDEEEDPNTFINRGPRTPRPSNLVLNEDDPPPLRVNPYGLKSDARKVHLKLTPSEVAEVAAGEGVAPIARPPSGRTADKGMEGRTEGDKTIRFVDKATVKANMGAGIDYDALDKAAEQEAAKLMNPYEHNEKASTTVPPVPTETPGGHIIQSEGRPVQMPKLTSPGGTSHVIRDTGAVHHVKSLFDKGVTNE